MTRAVHPIKPDEIVPAREKDIPDVVFETFNALIAKHYTGRSSSFKLEDAVAALVKKGIAREKMFEEHWLDVEGIYEAAGWKVVYDSPAYCESYPATFTFTRR
jgi:hypothetical protein